MKVLFDHQIFSLQRYGGISRYFANLHSGLNSEVYAQSYIAALYTENEYVKNEPFTLTNKLGKKLFGVQRDKYYKWNRRFSRWYIKRGDYDIFHPTYYDPYFVKHLKKPCAVTVHDMVHELYPQYFTDAAEVIARKQKVMQRADVLIAISDFTRQDIIRVYPHMAGKIQVVHHGYMDAGLPGADVSLPHSYILYVGERWHYKNFPAFVEGISSLLKADEQLMLICAGGKAFTVAEQQLFARHQIASRCLQMDVTDAVLKQLYRQASLFAFPSLHEGFGFPLLEAFAQKCPVICSNSSCLPEIAGNAAIYFNPLQPADIERAAVQVYHNKNLQHQMQVSGLARLALFTFEQCVTNTLNVYKSIITP